MFVKKNFLIIGNFKMNGSIKEYEKWIKDWNKIKTHNHVILAVPYLYLSFFKKKIKNFQISAQNVHYENTGAFTGEVSSLMLKDIGINWSIIGHSERKKYFGENDINIYHKIQKCIKNKLNVIVCVGENMEDRLDGTTYSIIQKQLTNYFKNIIDDDWLNIVIAYEPVWSIGTGRIPTRDQIENVHKFIREYLKKETPQYYSEIKIIYGGSVNIENIKLISVYKDVDGFLVGKKSLSEEFSPMIKMI